MNRNRSMGRRGRRPNRPRWTANLAVDSLPAASVEEVVLVGPGDYQTSTTLESECTLRRIRGNLQVANLSAVLASTLVCWIYKADQAFGVVDPANVAEFQSGNVLWSKVIALQPAAAGASGSWFSIDDIDVKANRILEGGGIHQDQIRFGISNVVGGGTCSYAILARSLLLLKA